MPSRYRVAGARVGGGGDAEREETTAGNETVKNGVI